MMALDAALLRDAWLGRLDAARAAEFDRSLIESDEVASALREAEYDLIDDYVADRLDASEREAVTTRLSHASDFDRKFEVALGLSRTKEERGLAAFKSAAAAKHDQRRRERKVNVGKRRTDSARPSISRTTVVAAATIAVLAVVLLRHAPDRHAVEPAKNLATPQRRASATLSLARDFASSEEGTKFAVPKGTTQFVLDLDTGGPHPGATYSVTVSSDGRESASYRGLPEHRLGTAAFVELPLSRLALNPADAAIDPLLDIHLVRDDDATDAKDWRLRLVDSE